MADLGTIVARQTQIPAAWLQDVNDLTYRAQAAGVAAVERMARDKLKDVVSIRDYLPPGGTRGVTDDVQAFRDAIDALPGSGGWILVLDNHAIGSRLDIAKPVYFIGLQQGAAYQPAQAASTELLWIGGVTAGAMVRIGLYGTGTDALWGGGFQNIAFNGNGTAAYGLEIADASYGRYQDVLIWNTTAAGLHGITDGTKANQPSAWNYFSRLFCDMRAALVASANSHGVLIEAVNGTNAGITLWCFDDLKVNHSGGDGVRWVQGGDGFTFNKPQLFRADAETGWGVHFASTNPADICNHCIFSYPIISSGAYFATAGLHLGTRFIDYDGQNLNTGVTELISGPGATEVAGNSTFGQLFGPERLLSVTDSLADDTMALVRYDSANNVVHTSQGAWVLATTSATAVAALALAGSGIRISTTAVANEKTLLSHCAATGGVGTGQWPTFQVGISVVDTTSVWQAWGFFSNNADPPTDGVWVEYDPTLSAGEYRCVCSRGGTQTVVENAYGLTGSGNPDMRWRIDVQPGRALFWYAAAASPNPQLWALAAEITTNVPITTTPLGAGVFVITRAASSAFVDLVDAKLVQRNTLR